MASLPEPQLPVEPPGSLIDRLLTYTRRVLTADHTALFEVDPEHNTVANRACNGVLIPAEVSEVREPMPLSTYLDPADVSHLLGTHHPIVLERRGTTAAGVRAYLERIGSERMIVVPVPFDSPHRLFLEVHYSGRSRKVRPDDIAEATLLAPMLGAALSSTNLAAENRRLLDESVGAAEALRASEALLRGLIDGLPGYAYQCGPDGETIFTSAQLGTMLGVSQERWRDAPDHLWSTHLHPDDRERVQAEWRRAIRDHRPHDSVYRMVDATGGSVWVRDREIDRARPRRRHAVAHRHRL